MSFRLSLTNMPYEELSEEQKRVLEIYDGILKHREYFMSKLGKGFSFKVSFQKWLKANAGKTYLDAVNAYKDIIKVKEKIDPQFEYNAYIKAFFSSCKGYTLSDAIKCWNYKKQLQVYKHLAEKIYPDKNVETYILWTNTAKLMPIV